MDDFRQNSPPWRDVDDDGACSIGLLVAHALQFTVFSSLDMSAYVMQCSDLCPLEHCGLLLLVYVVYILEFGKLVFFFHYFSTTYLLHTAVHSSVLYFALARSAGVLSAGDDAGTRAISRRPTRTNTFAVRRRQRRLDAGDDAVWLYRKNFTHLRL